MLVFRKLVGPSIYIQVVTAQASQDRSNKTLLDQLNTPNKKVDASNLSLGDYAMSKSKSANENAELFRIVV